MKVTLVKRYKNGNAVVEIEHIVKTHYQVKYNYADLSLEEIKDGVYVYGYDNVSDELENYDESDLLNTVL